MCSALVALVTDPALREAMCFHNAEIAPHHDWDAATAAFDTVYALAAQKQHNASLRQAGRLRVAG
jgi:hypothetical protein